MSEGESRREERRGETQEIEFKVVMMWGMQYGESSSPELLSQNHFHGHGLLSQLLQPQRPVLPPPPVISHLVDDGVEKRRMKMSRN